MTRLVASPAAWARVAALDPEAARAAKVAAKIAAATERNNRVRAILCERYPALFSWAQPLAIGIYHQIKAAIGGEIDLRELDLFLGFWTRRAEYRAALARGDRRMNLDGSDAGPAVRSDEAA